MSEIEADMMPEKVSPGQKTALERIEGHFFCKRPDVLRK